MRDQAPFQPSDLDDLDCSLLAKALSVVPMGDVANGKCDPTIVGLRHDVDNVIEPSVEFARWEAQRGYRATYYILHGTEYWADKTLLRMSVEAIAEEGHEIALHNNALAESSTTGRDPRQILSEALEELRGYGFSVSGTVAHGDPRCYESDGKVAFVNDEMFYECDRGNERAVCSLSDFGLDYDANWLPRAAYMSDSGGRWPIDFAQFASGFPYAGQTHVLLHPCWWQEAFSVQEVAV